MIDDRCNVCDCDLLFHFSIPFLQLNNTHTHQHHTYLHRKATLISIEKQHLSPSKSNTYLIKKKTVCLFEVNPLHFTKTKNILPKKQPQHD